MMIAEAIIFLRDQLDVFFKRHPEIAASVLLRSLVDHRGESTAGGEQGVSLTLVNIEEEISLRRPFSQRETASGLEIGPPALHLNLFVLVTAGIKAASPDDAESYAAALKRITLALQFFHSRSFFSSADSPGLPDGIEKLAVHQVNLTMQEQHNLWGYLGAKYLPSVLYKVSVLSLAATEAAEPVAAVREINLDLRSNSTRP